MKKKFICAVLALTLVCSAAAAEVKEKQAAYDVYGKVLSAEETEDAVVLEAEGYFGYHMDLNPSMTVRVTIDKTGTILSAQVTGTKDQTPGFDAMVTPEYMAGAYEGKAASPLIDVDAVAGATATSQAVLYAVRTAAYYAAGVYGYAADTNDVNKANLSATFSAEYQTIESTYATDAKKLGTVLYAAQGVTENGQQVLGLVVKGAAKFSYPGSARTGWAASEPNPYTMTIVIDQTTKKVCAWRIITDGTKRSEFFTVPEEKINAYETVEITAPDVFDGFMEGIVLSVDVESESSDDGPVITGTSIVYTGKTEQGTFSSQLVRNCFRTAADFFCNFE